MVKLGSVVEDHNGRFTGIVLKGSMEDPGQVYVRYWDETFGMYIHYMKHKNLLRITNDPQRVNRINERDPEYQKIIRTDVAEFALATNDKEWFDQLMKGGKRDEIEDI